MLWIPGGTFLMGSDDFYPEERPAHPVRISGFWMDEHAVTVAEFARFATATGYVTVAERAPTPPGTRARHPGCSHRDRRANPGLPATRVQARDSTGVIVCPGCDR
jgi:formylglycine-generating enzyme required for sulfatase activity